MHTVCPLPRVPPIATRQYIMACILGHHLASFPWRLIRAWERSLVSDRFQPLSQAYMLYKKLIAFLAACCQELDEFNEEVHLLYYSHIPSLLVHTVVDASSRPPAGSPGSRGPPGNAGRRGSAGSSGPPGSRGILCELSSGYTYVYVCVCACCTIPCKFKGTAMPLHNICNVICNVILAPSISCNKTN